MKKLILVRHAKSDWNDASLDDFDRPLNERGKRDAPAMAKHLHDKPVHIDAFVASPAKRAAKTARAFAKQYDREKEDILFIDELYHADTAAFNRVIAAIDDRYETIAIFSHNYGITDFANSLTSTRIDNIPTCGVFAVMAACDSWKDFRETAKEFWFFDYPKMLPQQINA